MNRLPDILNDLADADEVAAELRRLAEARPKDDIIPVNLAAVVRRRRDLERKLGSILNAGQFDLVRYRVEQFDGSVPPAAAVARSILLFQSLVTSVFDGLRTAPKRRHSPSAESVRLSAMTFAAAPTDSAAVWFTVPNERLLVLHSDLDTTFGLVFELLAARSRTMLRQLAERTGIASVTAAHAWAENAVQYGLTTTIGWRKASDERHSIMLSHSDALLLKAAIDAVSDQEVEDVHCDCELTGIDEGSGTFRVRTADGEEIAGSLGEGFPRGMSWETRRWYSALLVRAERIRYADGEVTTRWTLRNLIPQD